MTAPLLQVTGLVKRFGGLTATDHVTLDVVPGEIHALIGPNGAGKSTLINQLCGELAPDEGRIAIDGADVTALSAPERARMGLARTFQVTCLLDEETVLWNVAMALDVGRGHSFRFWRDIRRDEGLTAEARRALAGTGLEGRAGVTVSELSHGERKQLELVTALAQQPRLLLLDEPMAGLGHVESQAMIGMLAGLKSRCGMLLVEHDMDAVFALADRVSVLVYGRIIATDLPGAIRENPAVREAYLGEGEEA
ncbi:ABC transporter ATP-binding protein (plasmid) [Paroceanicella profunda]|uniref:ABC transporter ATP-binding protein n=1 Tax=Paroceanicella profunda TaxID=2579971 RepID=A0A5B8G2A4_9RHOB|nr:ABC transporter ATP-binding protein [Paroceanicella profunda]QDL94030.1 ABC transporter ATP-binding protein [Paroceanicella profunda]